MALRSLPFACAALLGLALAPTTPAQLAGFDSFEWTLEGDTSASSASLDDATLSLVGPDGACDDTAVWFETGPVSAGSVTVQLAWSTLDFCEADWPFYLIDGVRTPIPTSPDPGCSLPGSVEVAFDVPPGVSFGLGVGSTDCAEGAGSAVFTGFVFTPDPTQLAFWIDVGGDGTPDVAVGAPLAGRVTALSGQHGGVLWAWTDPGAGALVVGLSTLELAFKGGVMVPAPDKLLFLILDEQGRFATGGVRPASIPSSGTLWVQGWLFDPLGPAGLLSSRGLCTVL